MKIVHALFVDTSKGDAAENKSQPENLFFPAACTDPIDHHGIAMVRASVSTQHPWSLEQFPGFPELLHRNLGKDSGLNTVCLVPFTRLTDRRLLTGTA